MATLSRPFLATGAALVTAGALAAAPTVAPNGLLAAPTPAKLSAAQYQLTALSDITLQGINDAIANGWGGNLGPSNTFYPGVYNNDVKATGINGAIYYVLDQSGVVPFNLEDYYFEAGGLKAVAYVGIASVFGPNSLPGQLAKAVFGDQTMSISDAVVALTAGIPVIGDLTSVYFTGLAAGDTTAYGTGFAGVTAYVAAKYPAIAGLLSSLNIGGNSSHSHSGDSSESDGTDSDTDTDTEDSHDVQSESQSQQGNGHSHSAAAVTVSRTARAASALPAPVAASAVAAAGDTATEQAPTEVPAPVEVTAEAPAVSEAPAPRRVATRNAHAAAGERTAAGAREGRHAARVAN